MEPDLIDLTLQKKLIRLIDSLIYLRLTFPSSSYSMALRSNWNLACFLTWYSFSISSVINLKLFYAFFFLPKQWRGNLLNRHPGLSRKCGVRDHLQQQTREAGLHPRPAKPFPLPPSPSSLRYNQKVMLQRGASAQRTLEVSCVSLQHRTS